MSGDGEPHGSQSKAQKAVKVTGRHRTRSAVRGWRNPVRFLEEMEVLRVQALDLQVRECDRVGCINREDDAVDNGTQVSLHSSEIGKFAVRSTSSSYR